MGCSLCLRLMYDLEKALAQVGQELRLHRRWELCSVLELEDMAKMAIAEGSVSMDMEATLCQTVSYEQTGRYH